MMNFNFNNPTNLIFGSGAFLANPCEMTDEDCAGIFEKLYK